MQDPDDLPGLAHFTEHMLFYASGKYPEESEYNKHIEDHGGHTNAWTAAEHTNYQFTVNWDHLETSLDRFAQVQRPLSLGIAVFRHKLYAITTTNLVDNP